MPKEILQITLTKQKTPKSKLGKWLFWKIYFPVWKVWRPKMLAKFYWFMSNLMLFLIPKKERDALLKEFEEIEVHVKDETKENEIFKDKRN